MYRIAVLFHELDVHPENYVIHELAKTWLADGFDVKYIYGTSKKESADIIIAHVNLSIVPNNYLKFTENYPIVVNGKISDIRKSRLSSNRLRRGDDWNGPVIVKTDLNDYGKKERRFSRSSMENRFPILYRAKSALTRYYRKGIPFEEYPIFDSIKEVPKKYFYSQDFIVEKFLPEVENGQFHLRIYQALGNRWTCTRMSSDSPIIKARNSIHTEEIQPHPEVEQWRHDFGLDYGKIDYVIHDGKPILLDINKTTGATSVYREAADLQVSRRRLAEGLYAYFD
ncbi:MAG: hypothetical protein ACX936_04900 [Marinobacter sp.]